MLGHNKDKTICHSAGDDSRAKAVFETKGGGNGWAAHTHVLLARWPAEYCDFNKSHDYTQPALQQRQRQPQSFVLGRLMKYACACTCAWVLVCVHTHTLWFMLLLLHQLQPMDRIAVLPLTRWGQPRSLSTCLRCQAELYSVWPGEHYSLDCGSWGGSSNIKNLLMF